MPGAAVDDPAARNALALYGALPQDLRDALLAVEAVGAAHRAGAASPWIELDDPTAYRKGRTTWVRMGAAGDVEEQVTVLRALLGQLPQRPPAACRPRSMFACPATRSSCPDRALDVALA